jgi:hypothetical protein
MTRLRVWLKRLAFLIPGVLLLTAPYTIWWLRPSSTLDVVIVDKTVPFRNYREHASFVWLMRALKIRNSAGEFMDEARDFIGFDPDARLGHDLTDAPLEHADVLFIADSYGVYRGDYQGPIGTAALELSPRIYGGMSEGEVPVIQRFAGRGGMTIAEFNAFASPTSPAVRAQLETLFGVRWTKWAVRYWPRLEDMNEVPAWLGRLYEQVYQRPYDLRGGGLVFVHEDSKLLVLRAGRELTSDVITQVRTPAGALLDIPELGRFRFWMDVVERVDAEVLAEHVVAVNDAGRKALIEHGLPERFPALVRRRDAFYFAGDFVDTAADLGNPQRAGLLPWRRLTTGFKDDSLDANSYFFSWYAPILSRLLSSRAR